MLLGASATRPRGRAARRLAEAVGTSTRAVYSLFGSKEGLLAALGKRAFELLGQGVDQLPTTRDPAQDLVAAGAEVFREFAIEHPSMFRIAIQQTVGPPELADAFRPTRLDALRGLEARVGRLAKAGLLGGRSIRDATRQFHALCEGLAALELRGVICHPEGERIWHDALAALVTGFASSPAQTEAPHQVRGRTRARRQP